MILFLYYDIILNDKCLQRGMHIEKIVVDNFEIAYVLEGLGGSEYVIPSGNGFCARGFTRVLIVVSTPYGGVGPYV